MSQPSAVKSPGQRGYKQAVPQGLSHWVRPTSFFWAHTLPQPSSPAGLQRALAHYPASGTQKWASSILLLGSSPLGSMVPFYRQETGSVETTGQGLQAVRAVRVHQEDCSPFPQIQTASRLVPPDWGRGCGCACHRPRPWLPAAEPLASHSSLSSAYGGEADAPRPSPLCSPSGEVTLCPPLGLSLSEAEGIWQRSTRTRRPSDDQFPGLQGRLQRQEE